MNPEPPRGAGRSAKERMTLAAGSVSAATLISRILGFIRDMVIANLFGALAAADAFFVAFRIPNLLRRFTAEGALTAAFVPVFSELRERHGLARAFAMANNLVSLMAVLLMAVTAAGIVFAPWVVRVIAPGFTADPAVFELTALLTAVMFPYILLISLAALFMATLNSMGRFFVPAAAPALLNVAIIGCAFALKDVFAQPAMALAVGVLIGGALQLAAQWGTLAAMGYRFRPDFSLRHGDTLKVGALMVPAALGMAAAEVNILIGTLLATLLPQGSVSYLYYANRVAEFPLGIFGAAVGVAALPAMSGVTARGEGDGKLIELMSHAFRLTLFVCAPASAGLIALAGPICNALFERGAFDAAAREGTAAALVMFGAGVIAFAGVKALVAAFYALKDTATPARVASWLIILNVALGLLLMGPLAHAGLALASSLTSWLNVLALFFLLRRRVGFVDGRRIMSSGGKMIVASAVMGLAVWGYAGAFYRYDAPTMERVFHLLAAIALGVALYAGAALAMGLPEAAAVKERVRRRFGGRA